MYISMHVMVPFWAVLMLLHILLFVLSMKDGVFLLKC